MMAYLATRYGSPGEWSIEECAQNEPEPDGPCAIFDTFTETKAWLIDQTEAWYQGFRDDMREVRALRKSDVVKSGVQSDA
jgi:hypothetical protein